jgi:hypothetical protein
MSGEQVRYGQWPGNPKGVPMDTARCIENVFPKHGFPIPHQCNRKRGYGTGGLYCKQHAKRHGGESTEGEA